MHLPDQTHVGATGDRDLRSSNAGLDEQRASFRLKFVQDPVDRGRIVAVRDADRIGTHTLETQRGDQESEARRGARGGRNNHLANA